MIRECTDYVEQSKKLDGELNGYYEKYLKKIGITEEFLQKEMEAALNEEKERVKNKNGG